MNRTTAVPRPPVGWAVAVGVVLVALPVATLLEDDAIHRGPGTVDRFVRDHLASLQSPALALLARVLAIAGSTALLLVLSAAVTMWLWRTRSRAAAGVMLAPVAATVIDNLDKFVTERPRPVGGMAHFTSSFPSGHTVTATAVLLTMAFVLWRERAIAWPLAAFVAVVGSIAIGVSRLYRDAHWATDVIGGWIVGAGVAVLSVAVYLRLRDDRPSLDRVS